jgi:hypothetical protein
MTFSNSKMKCTPNTPECFGKYLIRTEIRYLDCIIKTEIYESKYFTLNSGRNIGTYVLNAAKSALPQLNNTSQHL